METTARTVVSGQVWRGYGPGPIYLSLKDIFVVNLDANGSKICEKVITTNTFGGMRADSTVVVNDTAYVLWQSYDGTNTAVFLSLFDTACDEVRRVEISADAVAFNIIADETGVYVAISHRVIKFALNGDVAWDKAILLVESRVAVGNDGVYTAEEGKKTDPIIILNKYDRNGVLLWSVDVVSDPYYCSLIAVRNIAVSGATLTVQGPASAENGGVNKYTAIVQDNGIRGDVISVTPSP